MIGFKLSQFTKHILKDAWSNFKASVSAEKRALGYKGQFRGVFPGFEYETVFEDKFDNRLNREAWGYAQPWGDFHPGGIHQYYDNDGTLSYVAPEGLILELRNIPKTWKKSELPEWRRDSRLPEEFTIPTGVGYVHSKQTWQYGWFEAWIKLPKGQSYWPAFWLVGENTWPPEIDILEAYSHKGPLYGENTLFGKFRKIPNRKIQPNLHYGVVEDGTKDDYGAYDIPVADATERFVQYACLWEEDRIEIYYDGIRVFQCTDPEILKWFNKENAQQRIILNHGLHENYPENPHESAMIVRKVKVMQRR